MLRINSPLSLADLVTVFERESIISGYLSGSKDQEDGARSDFVCTTALCQSLIVQILSLLAGDVMGPPSTILYEAVSLGDLHKYIRTVGVTGLSLSMRVNLACDLL
jgi:hypothetical protein